MALANSASNDVFPIPQSSAVSSFVIINLMGLQFLTCKDCLMSMATSEFSGSLSLPMTKLTVPEVFRSTEAA